MSIGNVRHPNDLITIASVATGCVTSKFVKRRETYREATIGLTGVTLVVYHQMTRGISDTKMSITPAYGLFLNFMLCIINARS